jgi:hypothetical protein
VSAEAAEQGDSRCNRWRLTADRRVEVVGDLLDVEGFPRPEPLQHEP